MKTYSHSLCHVILTSLPTLNKCVITATVLSVIIEDLFRGSSYKLKLRITLFRLVNCWLRADLYLTLGSSNWVKICLDSSSRILESCPLMSLWLFCWWLWTSLCPVCRVCRKILFCSFGMSEFFLRSTLSCFSYEYCWLSHLGIYSDYALSIWTSPAKFKQFWLIYRFFKPEETRQTQEIKETFPKFCLKNLKNFQNLLVVFICANKNYI